MIKTIVQKIKTKKLEKSENFFQSGYMKKKSRLRAFARTRAKNLGNNVDILWGGNLSMMFYSSSHECNKSFEVTSRRRVTLKTCSMNDLTSKTSYWDCRSHRICIVEKYNQAIITGQKTRQMNALSMQSGKYWLKVASIGSKRRVLGFTRQFS